jgi:putative ABC transport system permease protein
MLQALVFVLIRQWRLHKLRLCFTILGITMGVAVYFAIRTLNATLLDSYKDTVVKLGGKATLQITAGETGFPQDYLARVSALPGVQIAEPMIEVIAHIASNEGGNLMIVGMDASSDQKLHDVEVDSSAVHIGNPLEFILSPDSVAIPESLAISRGLSLGDPLPIFTSDGKQSLTVRATFQPSGMGEAFGGNVAVMDIHAAQIVFNRGTNIDRIDLATDPGVDTETVQSRLRAILPAGFEVVRPAARSKTLENSNSANSKGLLLCSLIALVIGMFIIFNSFSMSVNQRWKEIGILRALGMERSRVLQMFLGEAILLGIAGSLLGVASGFLLAAAANKIMSGIVNSIYGVISAPHSPVFHAGYAVEAVVLGIVASIVAAWLPSRAAAHLNVALALHDVESRQSDSILKFTRMPVGAGLVVCGLALTRFTAPRVGTLIQFSYVVLITLGFVMMLPRAAAWIGRAVRPLMDLVFGSEGVLAVESMIEAPLRTSATVGALMIGLGFVFSTQAFIRSERETFSRTLNNVISADIYIGKSDLIGSSTYHFGPELGKRLAAIAGVSRIEDMRGTVIPFRDLTVRLTSIETEGWFKRTPRVLDKGDEERVRALVPRGEGVIISRNFTTRWHVDVGDDLRLDTPSGPLTLPVLGTMEDYSSETGAIFIDREVYKAYWGDSSVDFFEATLNPGADPNVVKHEMERALADNYRAFVYTNADYRAKIDQLLDQFFLIYYSQMIIAIMVGAVGIVNTLVISISERKREIGVIRAIGGLRGQVGKMIVLEAVALTIAGLTMGLLKGLCDTYFMVRIAAAALVGDSFSYSLPGSLVLLTVPIVMAVSLISAWWPARQASRLPVVEAIGYE